MRFSQLKNMFGSLLAAGTLVGLALMMPLSASAQKTDTVASDLTQALSATISQCANGPFSDPNPCIVDNGATGWISGNVNAGKGHYNEGDFLPYRVVMSGLTSGTEYTVVIGYDRKDGAGLTKYAIDYIGTYNATEPNAFPCGPTPNIPCPTGSSTIAAPVDALNTAEGTTQVGGVLTMWGGTLLSAQYVPCPGTTISDPAKRCIAVRFTATDTTAILAWGGHLATQADWGVGNTLTSIPGSSYHSRVIGFGLTPADFPTTYPTTGGNQDIQLQASNVNPGTIITIFKKVANATGSSNTAFSFTSNSTELGTSFSLTDNRSGDATSTGQTSSVYTSGATVTVTENAIAGWTLQDIVCSGGTTSVNLGTKTATITVVGGAIQSIQCTFTNGELGTTAAPADITGRVATDFGTGIRGASMKLTNLSTGEVRYAVTNNFGYYYFTGAMTDDVYVLSVASKRYTFAANSMTFTLRDNLSGMNFIANTTGTGIIAPISSAAATVTKSEAPAAAKVESPSVIRLTIVNLKKNKKVDEDQDK
jgi:hypothetical protein